MRLQRLVGLILSTIGLALLLIWVYEEYINNFNYYFLHQVTFGLLIFFGILLFGTGLLLISWERELKKQSPSLEASGSLDPVGAQGTERIFDYPIMTRLMIYFGT